MYYNMFNREAELKLKNMKCTEANNYFDKVINSLISKNLIVEEFNQISKRERPSILISEKLKSTYGQILQMVIDQESSDEESSNDIEAGANNNGLSLRRVCEYIFDNKTLRTIDINLQEFPEGVYPGILIKHIDEDINALDLKNYITKKCGNFKIEIEVIRTFSVGKIKYAFISFNILEQCRYVFNLFKKETHLPHLQYRNENQNVVGINNNYIAKSIPKNSSSSNPTNTNFLSVIDQEVYYCYDFTDYKESFWYAVVVKNLDENCTKEKLKEFCQMITPNVLYTTTPEEVFDRFYSIIVTNDLDEAEKICVFINNQCNPGSNPEKRLRAKIHPKSCKIRRFPEKSHFSSILIHKDNKNTQLYNEDNLSLKKVNMSNDSQFHDSRRSAYSVDSSKYISQSGKKNLDFLLSDEYEKSHKDSLLSKLVTSNRVDNSNNKTPIINNSILVNSELPSENKIENKLSKFIKTAKSKKSDHINNINFNKYDHNEQSSLNRVSAPVDNKSTTSELKFSNIFIRPVSETKILNKNKPSSTNPKFSKKKRNRDEVQTKEAESIPNQFERENKNSSESNSEEIYNKIKNQITPIPNKPSNIQLINTHLNRDHSSSSLYNPRKDTVILNNSSAIMSNEKSKSVQASYYSPLQKMPGSHKNSKRSLNNNNSLSRSNLNLSQL